MHPVFDPALWDELRLDIDPHANPDIVGSVLDMRSAIASQSQNAVCCSHILEHLYSHEVPVAPVEAGAEARRLCFDHLSGS
jgi:hypothetical protein